MCDTLNVSVEEKVAIFLLIVGHAIKMRVIRSTYEWTLEPISRHFNEVLRCILSLCHEFIKLPDPSTIQPDEVTELKLYDILTASERKFESLLALPMARRKTWLLMQLNK